MQAQLETLSSLERRMIITLPMSSITAQIAERLKRAAKSAKIQGFRPGKAPLKIVEMSYGAQIREDVMGEQVQRGFRDAVSEHNLRVAGFPRFEAVDQNDKDNFTFSALFEVYPEIKIGELSAKEIEKPCTSVAEVEEEKTLDILRKQRTRFVRVERAASEGDRVIIDFKGTIDGAEFAGGSAENFPFTIGQGQMLAEFEAGVIGLKEGDTQRVDVNFPADYHGKDVAGKQAVFEILVKNVAEAQLPDVDSDFARVLGIADGDVSKMRIEVRKNIEREVKRRLASRTKENVMQALLDVTEIQLPKVLVQLEIKRLTEEAQRNFKDRGLDSKGMSLPSELFQKQAERRVALGLILSEFVAANKLVAKPEDVKARIEEFAESYEQPQDVIQWYYADPQRLEQPTSMVIEDMIVEYVLSQATVVEKEIPFDQLMGSPA